MKSVGKSNVKSCKVKGNNMLETHRKLKTSIGIILLLLLIIAGAVTYYYKFYEEDLNKSLPVTITLDDADEDTDPEGIAYRFWLDYMTAYSDGGASPWKRLTEVRFNKFQLLAGDADEFAVAVTFWAKLEKGKWSTHHSWGELHDDNTIRDIQWTMRIKKTGEKTYTLERIENTANAVAGLTPLEDKYQKEAGIALPDENNRYEIVNEKLKITFDNGFNWQEVPLDVEELFQGDYSGSNTYLIEDSYIITPERTAFVIGGGDSLRIMQSTDEGKTWVEDDVSNPFVNGSRLRILGFTSKKEGYLILTGDRTMSFEANTVLKTHNGGETWENVGSVLGTDRMITSGGFINKDLGFISFDAITVNDEKPRPSLYRSTNGGKDWAEVEVPIPVEYAGIFTTAEVPTFDGSQGTLLVNQGPNGDYQGGKVMAKYISIDDGASWTFANLVDPEKVMDRDSDKE